MPVDYHAWTHRPKALGGTDPIEVGTIPCFRAYQHAIVQTISNNADTDLRFDRYQNSDTSVFSTGWTPGTPDYIDTVQCLQRGLYLVHVMVDPSPLGGEIGLSIEHSGATYTGPPTVILDNQSRAGDGTTGSLSWTVAMSFPPVWGEQSTDLQAPALANMQFKMLNKTGGSIDTWSSNACMVEIHQLYAFDYETLAVQSQA